MPDASLWVAVGMALVGGLVPLAFMLYLVWQDRIRQNRRGFDV